MSSIVTEPAFGPCVEWATAEEVAAFCTAADVGSDTSVLEEWAEAASELLFEFSGRRFNGECEDTVRPCRIGAGCWEGFASPGWPFVAGVSWSWGWNGTYGAWDWGWWGGGNSVCGCRGLSQVELAGYPVTSIVEVKINGAVLDPLYDDGSPAYRLDEYRYLVRMNDPDAPDTAARWPSCQNLALEDDQEGTWSIRYTYGQPPPVAGVLAAKQLACELYQASIGGECRLPAGTTTVTRQGVTVDRLLFKSWALTPAGWGTGLPLVDAFLNAFNPEGVKMRPLVWSPDIQQKPRHTGS